MTPYEAALGARFHHLSPQVRQLHGARNLSWEGQVTVQRGANPFSGPAARLLGFPQNMDKAPFRLSVQPQDDESEVWVRDFDGHKTVSRTRLIDDGILEEEFGKTKLRLEPRVKADQLQMRVIGARPLGLVDLPRHMVPKSRAHIWQDEAGRYRFDIESGLPFRGKLIRYFGWLRPAATAEFSVR